MSAVLEDVHINEMDRATSRLELVRINPTRQFLFVPLDETGHWKGTPALFTWQNGTFFDTGGNVITDLNMVPEKFRREIEENPVTVTTHSPAVTAVCRICGDKMNQSELDAHYIGHYTEAVAKAGEIATLADKNAPKPPKHDANLHQRG